MSNTEVISTSFEPGAAVKAGTIPLCVPELGGNEWRYVKECLDTNWVSSAGPFVSRFEQSIASYVGAEHAVATVNGTAALHVALIVAGVKPDDEVLLPALSFIAPANAVRYAGAWPVFMDVEAEHWQLDPQKTADFIDRECDWKDGELRNRNTGRRVGAILPVHILGHPVDLDPLIEIARKFDLALVEDSTESLGAKYKGQMLGQTSDIACFSFNGNKLITTGGGGMIVTRKPEWAERARYLTTQAKDNPIEYIHKEVGYNYRLTNLQAALGCAQVEQLDEFLFRKQHIAQQYNDALLDVPGVSTMSEASWATSACWLYTVRINEEAYGSDRFALFRLLGENEIQTRPLWQPLHRSPAHAESPAYYVEVADEIHREALSLPSSVGLSEQEMARVIKVIRDSAQQAA
jgi:perosamine synthetase